MIGNKATQSLESGRTYTVKRVFEKKTYERSFEARLIGDNSSSWAWGWATTSSRRLVEQHPCRRPAGIGDRHIAYRHGVVGRGIGCNCTGRGLSKGRDWPSTLVDTLSAVMAALRLRTVLDSHTAG